MTTYESISTDITNLFASFDKYVNMYETNTWLNSVSIEELKNGFKLGKLIEDSVRNLQLKQCTNTFFSVLNAWWKQKSRTKVYSVDFFLKACDNLLTKFFQKNIPIQTLDNAIRMYTSLFPRERFEKVISRLILMSASHTQIIDYTIANKDNIDIQFLQCRLLLTNWLQECECGRIENVKGVISNMFLSYKLQSTLPLLVTILTVNIENEAPVTNIILENLYMKMEDRSVLSKQFWLSLFRYVDRQRLSKVCLRYNEFLIKLFDFIIYIGCMMNYIPHNSEMKWMGDPETSICPNLIFRKIY
ncbi:uncharacterized protein LOC116169259 isoform X2 [Photinus pyralis]|uniref:Uncharacterized protein n=1 Tax=Photinus pyralis TaxID=7054 RepID=A0A1Y1NAA0_PHOPY|nr:uncharacterized protein LOC116169259 isoform X2 [Photinus pyralis]